MTDEKGEPLFCLKDVCRALSLDGKQVIRRLSDGVVSKHPIVDSLGREQLASFVDEDGLYDTILESRKQEARQFRKWVTSEVLPQIRRTGGYIPVEEADDEVTIMARALQIMQRTIGQKDELIEQQTALIEEQQPKALFCDAVTGSVGVICIRELAKLICQNGYEIGEKRLYRWLREHGYLCTKGTAYNVPMQCYLEQGLFRIEEFTYTDSLGIVHTRLTPKVTGKGQLYFINLFKNLYHQGV